MAGVEQDLGTQYQEELRALREDAKLFARQHPKIAGRLGLLPGVPPDPLVERLLESFAWLTARVRLDAESRLPLVTQSLLGLLYPNFTAPLPSMSVAAFCPNVPSLAGLAEGYAVPSQTALHNRDERGSVLRWRTAWPLTLQPVVVRQVELLTPAAWMPPAAQRATSVLRLRMAGLDGLPLSRFRLPRLRLFLAGDRSIAFRLHEWVHSACIGIFLADDADTAAPQCVNLKRSALRAVGLESDELLLPESNYALPGYQLMQEYFAFPEHLLFWELRDLDRRRDAKGDWAAFDVLLALDAPPPSGLETHLHPECFEPCAVPVVNLFERAAEPIRVDYTRSGYRLIPDLRRTESTEVHSVLSVVSLEEGERCPVTPYFSLLAPGDVPPRRYWHLRRRRAPDGVGTEVFLHFKDPGFDPATAKPYVVSTRVLCTNRHRATDSQGWGKLQRDTDLPVSDARLCTPPTPQHDPPLFGGELWKLVSHLALHHLSLSTPDAVRVLRETLRLYAPPHDAAAQRQIAGLRGLEAEPVVRPLRTAPGCTARGTRFTLTLDEDAFHGASAFVFAEVLNVFLGLYAGVNTITQLRLSLTGRKGVQHVWSPRSGARPLL